MDVNINKLNIRRVRNGI